jgi:hypothetical protein
LVHKKENATDRSANFVQGVVLWPSMAEDFYGVLERTILPSRKIAISTKRTIPLIPENDPQTVGTDIALHNNSAPWCRNRHLQNFITATEYCYHMEIK